MSRREKLFLVSYDIADPQRLGRVARFMVKRACRVQYSVYALQATSRELDNLLAQLETMIDIREDDVRAYPLPKSGEVALLGTQMFPDDVLLVRDGRNVFRLGAGQPELSEEIVDG